ncbi:MAG: GGDEF domain-containing protein [Spirochaetales bacterium]|nr:GGDEF domain-containing protein [Spirochaetales bacterium]
MEDMDNKKFDVGLGSHPDLIKHLGLLSRIGIWEHISKLEKKLNEHQKMLGILEELFRQRTIIDLVTFISSKIMDSFVPNHLAFLIKEADAEDKLSTLCFKNLQMIEDPMKITSLEPFRKVFDEERTILPFDFFKDRVEDEEAELIKAMEKIEPDFLVPLMGMGGTYGLIIVGRKVVGSGYSYEELDYIQKILTFASVSLTNTLHYRWSIVDSKTDLFEHDFFMQRLKEEISRSERYAQPLSLLMLDIDHFKDCNDTYGHLAGDKVLQEMARLLKMALRKGDIAARFGGEEFVVLLVQCEHTEALKIAERIRLMIRQMSVFFQNQEIKVTVSIGISGNHSGNSLDPQTLIDQADKALYQSKKNGRNQCTLF